MDNPRIKDIFLHYLTICFSTVAVQVEHLEEQHAVSIKILVTHAVSNKIIENQTLIDDRVLDPNDMTHTIYGYNTKTGYVSYEARKTAFAILDHVMTCMHEYKREKTPLFLDDQSGSEN